MGDLRSGCPQQPGGTHPWLTSNRRRPDSTVALSEPRDHKFLPQMLHKLPKREVFPQQHDWHQHLLCNRLPLPLNRLPPATSLRKAAFTAG